MDEQSVFHLSFPVTSLKTPIAFYQDCLGASVGRSNAKWVDVILFGHQLTLHAQPTQVLPREARGVRHFGAILGWAHWEVVSARALAYGPADIQHRFRGEAREHVKLLVEDPDGNVIEIKAYKESPL